MSAGEFVCPRQPTRDAVIQKMSRRSNFAFAALVIPAVIAASFGSLPAVGLEAAKLEVTPVEPARFEKRGDIYFADFGKDVYGNLQITFAADVPDTNLIVRLGEKLERDRQH